MRVVEAFSGIGSQKKALMNIGIKHEVVATIEWDINAIYAYDIIHNGPQDLSNYEGLTREDMVEKLSQYNLSSDGKSPLNPSSFGRYPLEALKRIHFAIIRTKNLVDIQKVHANDLPKNIDLLTYSFPCQDLSISGSWHGNNKGISKEENTRSGLLWQVERILMEYEEHNLKKPHFLLMENVSNILSSRHIEDFNEWRNFLKDIGYVNQVYTLQADDFGVPQTRKRTFMISVFANHNENTEQLLSDYFLKYNLEGKQHKELNDLSDYLRLDYSNPQYKLEAILSNPNDTPSRQKIKEENDRIYDGKVRVRTVRTITTKQDRHPNSGVIDFPLAPKGKSTFRYLTPRESFLLMGFEESDYQNLVDNDFMFNKSRSFYGIEKLHKLAGNSIVVPVLEEIFYQMIEIGEEILKIF